jgi:hypothetical protein
VTQKKSKLDQVVADARGASEQRELGYRERALKMYPHICGRCSREFGRENLHELTVHHRMAVTGNCCVCIAMTMNTSGSWRPGGAIPLPRMARVQLPPLIRLQLLNL